MFPLSHKTVIVLDMGPYMARPSGQLVDLESRGAKGCAQLEKSLWTCSVEAGLEYLRIISDLFPDTSHVRFMVNGRHITQSWAAKHLSLDCVMENLASCGLPDADADMDHCFILDGLTLAIDAMTLATDIQKAAVVSNTTFKNKGRIIVATHIKNADELEMLKGQIVEQIDNANKVVRGLEDKNYVLIDDLDVTFLHISPVTDSKAHALDSTFATPQTQLSRTVSLQVVCTHSGRKLTDCVHALLLSQFNLGSTTVSGIPMKEEQTTGQSANYDVELFHLKEVHSNLEKCGILGRCGDECVMADKGKYKTLLLQWCSPNVKQASFEQLHVHSHAVKITPAAVNSRPSSCLTSFILSGKTVMLEVPNKGPAASVSVSKTISHMLTSHGGHIYMHNIYMGRSFLDDPPSIIEGPGGSISEYRFNDFAQLIKELWLAPANPNDNTSMPQDQLILEKRRHIARLTKFWPLITSETVLTNLSQKLEPLLSHLKRRTLADRHVAECREKILSLMTLEKNNEPLTIGNKVKGVKREDEYSLLWTQLEAYMRNYAHLSYNHCMVLNSLLQSHNRPNEQLKQLQAKALAHEQRDPMFCAGDEESGEITAPTPAKVSKMNSSQESNQSKVREKMSLTDFWMKEYEDKYWKHWKDFDGRIEANGNTAELYPGLKEKLEAAKNEKNKT